MTSQTNGDRLQGASLAQDLFEDMGRKVSSMASADTESGEVEQSLTEEIESLCMNCHEDGVTRLLLTRIPFFREIVIMSFSCEHCGFQNNEIQSAGQIQERGVRFTFKVEGAEDLERQVVKSDSCVLRIEELDLEVPAGKGRYTNVEGIVAGVRQDLEQHQQERLQQMPEVGEKVAGVISSLKDMEEGRRYPFTVSLDDPSGNSWIEPRPGEGRRKWVRSEYGRTSAQNGVLGLGDEVPAPEQQEQGHTNGDVRPEYHAAGMVPSLPTDGTPQTNNVDAEEDDIVENQVYSFPASCPGCTKPCTTNMKMVKIPYFKQVVLMSTVCEHCGYRSNEVKTGGEVPEKGRRITLRVKNQEDLARDILKSESAALLCPELSLRVEPGTMGGRFTTVEGILTQIRRDLRAQAFGLEDGDAEVPASDSMPEQSKQAWDVFFAGLEEAIAGAREFDLVLEDPLAGSYVQSLTAPAEDPQIGVEDYVRTEQEEEELGLRDMKVEGYEQEEHATENGDGR